MSLGLTLHNPFNLKRNGIPWQGLINPGSHPVFCQFESDLMGLRAGFDSLKNQRKEGIDTLDKLMVKYAPSSDHNNTTAYIKVLSEALNVQHDTVLNFSKYEVLFPLGKAIILHEQGEQPFDDNMLTQAIRLAGVIPEESRISFGMSDVKHFVASLYAFLCSLCGSKAPK